VNVIIGSKNPAKIGAVEQVFSEAKVTSISVPSHVASQPFSDEETKSGAINRAKEVVKRYPEAIGIGLEGGVMYIGDELFLCNWGALVTPNQQVYTAGGARIKLSKEIEQALHQGEELGDVMDRYAKKRAVRTKEGAIGIFTNDLISRQQMFVHIVMMLKGQFEYWQQHSEKR